MTAPPTTIPVMRRTQVYLLLVGVVVGMLAAGLAVPMIFGESVTSGPGSSSTLAAGDAGAGAAGSAADAAGAAGAGAAGANGGAAASGGTSAAGGAIGGGGVAGSAGGGAGSVTGLTATDRGVSATTIKLGFLLLDIGTVGRLGVTVAINPAQQQAAFQSYVDDINSRGGINGRKIQPYYRAYDVTDRDDQIAACRELTQDRQVFAVLGGFNIVDPNLCVVEENKTPLISNANNNPDWVFARAGGRLITLYPRSGRMMAATVAEMERVGLASKRIGIMSDGLNDPGGQVAMQLQRLLEQRGHKVVYRGQLSDDISTASSQVPVEENRMQTAGGTGAEVVVFLSSNAVYGTQFVNQANSQNYHPAYLNTDWASNNGDTTNSNMPESYDGSLAFTFNRGYSGKKPSPVVPEATRCRDIYNQRSGRTLAEPGNAEYGLTVGYCDVVRLFETMATSAGPDLTRARLIAGLDKVGLFASAAFGPGALSSTKFDLSDVERTERWGSDCKCWHPVDAFHRPGG